MLTFDEDAHQFSVTYPSPSKVNLDFGPTKVFVSMATVPNVALIETTVAGGKPLFNSGLIPPAIRFSASCLVLGKEKGGALTAPQLLSGFEFGFVQGIQQTDVVFEYWGQRAGHGRIVIVITMPGTLEVDTDTGITPWSRAAATRFRVEKGPAAPGKSAGLLVSAEFEDHPLFHAAHTITAGDDPSRYLRSITSKRMFRTVFCYRDKGTKKFEAISSTDWKIEHQHLVKYADKGKTRTVIDKVVGHFFPRGGSPSNVSLEDRKLMGMAKAGAPLLTPAILADRFGPGSARTITVEEKNSEFDPMFWQ